MSYNIELIPVTSGFEGEKFWCQARCGTVYDAVGQPVRSIVTTQKALRSGSDIFYGLNAFHSDDMGKTWQGPTDHEKQLGRQPGPGDFEACICDMEPQFHRASGKLLLTGHTVYYLDDKHPPAARPREIAYSIYDLAANSFTPWATVDLPDEPIFKCGGSGSAQIYEEADGSLLVPIYTRAITEINKTPYCTCVARMKFDGQQLSYIEHGNLMSIEVPRGLYEPSVTKFGDKYFLTLRNDETGYVTSSKDGLQYDEPIAWCFDDGENLGNYNTQQHWLRGKDGLYLVYTRRGLDNDHIMRHRGPLVMARVDTEKLCVIRETEQIVVPERGARMGNFSINHVADDEAWVVVAEWMQPVGCEAYGSDNTIWCAKVKW